MQDGFDHAAAAIIEPHLCVAFFLAGPFASWPVNRTLAKPNAGASGLIRRDKGHACVFERALDAGYRFNHRSVPVFETTHCVCGDPSVGTQLSHSPAQGSSSHANLHRRDHDGARRAVLVDKYIPMEYVVLQNGYSFGQPTMFVPALRTEIQVYNLLRERLESSHPSLDDETIRDTLEGITTLHELIAELIRSALVDETLQAALRARIDEMRVRLARLAERGLKKRQLALEAMNDAGLKKLEQPDFTASARLGAPPLIVNSEQAIPETYWVSQPPRLDRQTLTFDLRRGDEISGACLGNATPILTVRTK